MAIAAIGQLCSTASMSHNLALYQVLVKKAVVAGAKALFLPEATDYIASSPSESISLAQHMTTSTFVLGLQKAAKESGLAINVGIHVPFSAPSSLDGDGQNSSTAPAGSTKTEKSKPIRTNSICSIMGN